MENKIIIFSNIKGGVGKTTLCALFASYLAEKGLPVIAIDADLQASLFRHRKRERDVNPDIVPVWNVELLNTADAEQTRMVVDKLKSVPGLVLVDCPGNLNDRNLECLYASADAAVVPLSFDADTVDATGLFIKALNTVAHAKLIFVPNRINASEKKYDELRQRAQTTELLGLVGTVVPRVKQTVAIKRYTTVYPLEKAQLEAVRPAFEAIMSVLQIKANSLFDDK